LPQRILLAGYFGAFIWHLFGGFSWQVNQAGLKEKQGKRKEK
jgi:hypothetical protein